MKLSLFAAGFLLLALLTQAIATTNYNGSASFTTTRGLNNIATYCPDQTYCTSQLADVQNTSYLDFTCSCKLASITINATWKDDNANSALNGHTVVFLHLFEDGNLLGVTGPAEKTEMGDIGYGLHKLTFVACLANQSAECGQKLASQLIVNITKPIQKIDVIVSKNSFNSIAAFSIPQQYDNSPATLHWYNYTPASDFDTGIATMNNSIAVVNGAYSNFTQTIWNLPEGTRDFFSQIIENSKACVKQYTGFDIILCVAFQVAPILTIGEGGVIAEEEGIAAGFGKRVGKAPAIGTVEKIEGATLTNQGAEITTRNAIGGKKIRETHRVNPYGKAGSVSIENLADFIVGAVKDPIAKTTIDARKITATSFKVGNDWVEFSKLEENLKNAGNLIGGVSEINDEKIMEKTAAATPKISIKRQTITSSFTKNEYQFRPGKRGAIDFTGPEGSGQIDAAYLINGKPLIKNIKGGNLENIAKYEWNKSEFVKTIRRESAAGKAFFDLPPDAQLPRMAMVPKGELTYVQDIFDSNGWTYSEFANNAKEFSDLARDITYKVR